MELSFKSSTNSSVTIFPPKKIYGFNKEVFVDHALEIHSLISIELANCPETAGYRLQQALLLIDKLDGILESLENINEYYGYYYQVLLEMLEQYGLDKKMEKLIDENLWNTPKY